MSNSQLPKAIIFDWDNTLVNTWPLIQNALNETMVKMGKEPWSLEKIKNSTHNSMRESFPILFGKEKSEEAAKTYQKSYKANHLQQIKMLPNALDLINKLYEMNITLIIISNKVGSSLRKEAQKLEIQDKFFAIIGSMDAQYDKPDKAPVDLALEGSDLDPDKDPIWFIGDTIVDIECAYNANCQPVLYGEGLGDIPQLMKRQNLEGAKPMLHFQNHQEILEYIKNW